MNPTKIITFSLCLLTTVSIQANEDNYSHCPSPSLYGDTIVHRPVSSQGEQPYKFQAIVTPQNIMFSSVKIFDQRPNKPEIPELTLFKVKATGAAVKCFYKYKIDNRNKSGLVYFTNFGDAFGKLTWENAQIKTDTCTLNKDPEYQCHFTLNQHSRNMTHSTQQLLIRKKAR